MGREHLRRAHSGAVEIDLRVCVNPPYGAERNGIRLHSAVG
jgi:hypothetical protein